MVFSLFSLQFGLSGWADTYWLGWVRLVGSDWLGQIGWVRYLYCSIYRPRYQLSYLPPKYQLPLSTSPDANIALVVLPFSTAPSTYIALLNRSRCQLPFSTSSRYKLDWVGSDTCTVLLNRPRHKLPFSTGPSIYCPSQPPRYPYCPSQPGLGTDTISIELCPVPTLPISSTQDINCPCQPAAVGSDWVESDTFIALLNRPRYLYWVELG